MPTLKKRSGKTTITLYAQEERQIRGAIESLSFAELNDKGPLGTNGGVLASGLAAWLKMLEPPAPAPKEKQGELIPDKPKPF